MKFYLIWASRSSWTWPKVNVNSRSSVDLKSPMLHAKFHHRTLVLEIFFTIYDHGGHLDHVTKFFFLNSMSPLPKEASHKIWLWLAKWFQRRRDLNIMIIYMYTGPVQGQAPLWGKLYFKNINLPSLCCNSFFFKLNDCVTDLIP